MRSIRTLACVAARRLRRGPTRPLPLLSLLPLLLGACLADPAAPVDRDAPAALRIVAQVTPSNGERRVHVVVGYEDNDERFVELPVTPSEVTVPPGTTVTRGVSVRIGQCLAYFSNAEGAYCPLRVELSLLDDVGRVVARGTGSAFAQRPGETIEVSEISLLAPAIFGVVRDAVTGAGVPAAGVALYAGTVTTGAPQAQLVAGAGGAFLFPDLDDGTYTLVPSGNGYVGGASTPVVVGVSGTTRRDIVLTPLPPPGQTRVVLTWGDTPLDLDAHLWGPRAANDYHIWFLVPSAAPYAVLDVDDTDAFGPETVTIRQQVTGPHVYAVHNFSERLSTTSMAIAQAGARVQLFRSTGLVAEFTPPNQPGTLWAVFSLDGTTITPLNRMTFNANPMVAP